jgi:hypothetical protein
MSVLIWCGSSSLFASTDNPARRGECQEAANIQYTLTAGAATFEDWSWAFPNALDGHGCRTTRAGCAQPMSTVLSRLDSASRPLAGPAKRYQALMGKRLHLRPLSPARVREMLQDILEGRLSVYRHLDGHGLTGYVVDHHAHLHLRQTTAIHRATKVRQQALVTQLPLWQTAQ